MSDLLLAIGILVVWIILQVVVFPRLGISTLGVPKEPGTPKKKC